MWCRTVASGEVLTTLQEYRLSIFGTHLYLLYLPNRHQTRAVRTCIDFLLAKARSRGDTSAS
jgi:DNA-binding transcriptional LysR family regulator